jgi:hypothetical protein
VRFEAEVLSEARDSGAGGRRLGAGRVAVLMAGGILLLAGGLCPAALWVVLRDGPPAVCILLAGLGLGRMLLPLAGLGRLCPAWRLIGGLAAGGGALSLLVLALGWFGWLAASRWNWAWVGPLAIAGAWEAVAAARAGGNQPGPSPVSPGSQLGEGAWWLASMPFAGLALLAATMPPGTLWPSEGNGYDVLEYHLGAPREYFEIGTGVDPTARVPGYAADRRVGFLPHNVYSAFPFSVEMLYLLAMVLRGDAVRAAFAAQLVNFLLGGMTVAAAWLAGRRLGAGCGRLAALLVASCPMITHLSGLAYVENGMMMFAAVGLAAALEADRSEPGRARRWLGLAGVMSGLACGCKYIALPQVLLPLGLASAAIGRRRRVGVVGSIGAFGLGAALTLSPWLIKNAVATGNPVFPLAHAVFGGGEDSWSADGAARWAEGHRPAPEDRSAVGRLRKLWAEVAFSGLFGPVVGLAAASGLLAAFRLAPPQAAWVCWVMVASALATWAGFTHLVGRFAVVIIVPCAIIAAATAKRLWRGRAAHAVVTASVLVNGWLVSRLFIDSAVFEICRLRVDDGLAWFTRGEWPTHGHVPRLNALARPGGRVLMVADARRFYLDAGVDYCVVFNRNPFAEAAAALGPAELLHWLRDKGYGHVFVNWSEMRRLRGSRYGFWAGVDEALFQRLAAAGLRQVEEFRVGGDEGPVYGTLFALPDAPPIPR